MPTRRRGSRGSRVPSDPRGIASGKPASKIRNSRARVKSARAIPHPVKITRPARWWRDPLTPARMRDLRESGAGEDEIAVIRAQERQLKTELIKNQIRELRKYSRDFEASAGYRLKDNELIRLHPSKLKKLKDAHEQIVRAKGQPYLEVRPRSQRQEKDTLKRAGKILPGQKVYFLHGVSTKDAETKFTDGRLQIVHKVRGGEIHDINYYFPRKPRSWGEVKKFTRELQRRGMKTGNYKLLNSLYGSIGGLVSRDQMLEQLDEYFGTYNKFMAGTILGWRWYGTSLDKARGKQRREKTTAERFKETRDFLARKEKRKIEEKLGKVKRCPKCRRKKCVCKAPEF